MDWDNFIEGAAETLGNIFSDVAKDAGKGVVRFGVEQTIKQWLAHQIRRLENKEVDSYELEKMLTTVATIVKMCAVFLEYQDSRSLDKLKATNSLRMQYAILLIQGGKRHKLLSNVLNFKFLPPINKIQNDLVDKSSKEIIESNKIGDYQPLNQAEKYDFVQLEDDLANFEKLGYKKTIVFDPTSLNNKLVSQFFEVNEEEMKKLDAQREDYYDNK